MSLEESQKLFQEKHQAVLHVLEAEGQTVESCEQVLSENHNQKVQKGQFIAQVKSDVNQFTKAQELINS